METMNLAGDNHILLYQTADGETRLEVLYRDESLWLSQRDMAELLQVTTRNISAISKTYIQRANCRLTQLGSISSEFNSKAAAEFPAK